MDSLQLSRRLRLSQKLKTEVDLAALQDQSLKANPETLPESLTDLGGKIENGLDWKKAKPCFGKFLIIRFRVRI